MRVLFLSPYVPSRIRVRPFQWIKALAALGHEVHLVALQPPEDAWAPSGELASVCASLTVHRLSRARTLVNAIRAVPSSTPLQAASSGLPAAERAAADVATRHRVDVVHVEHMRGVAMASRVTGYPRVLDAVDSITGLFEAALVNAPGRGQRLAARLDLRRTRAFEARVTRSFERVVVTSPAEAATFVRLGADSRRLSTVANGVDTTYFTACWRPAQPPCVVFTGKMSYHANEAAALRLVHRIMPLVWQERADVVVAIVGKDPSPRLQALAADRRVTVTGYVEDIRPWLSRAAVAVSPLVYGAGIQNKVLEALSSGVPTVASPQAVGALSAEPGRDVLVATTDAAFAGDVLSVIGSPALASALGRQGRAYVDEHHDWLVQARCLVEAYEAAITARADRAP